MKRILTTLLLYISFGASFAQNEKNVVRSIDLAYGYKIVQQNFQDNLNYVGNFSFASPLQFIGIGATDHTLISRSSEAETQLYYCQIIPRKILTRDSLDAYISGGMFSLGFGIDLFKKSKLFDMFIFGGFNMGRLRLYGENMIKQKNFYFSPKLSLQPKVKIGPIAFSIRLDYEYDVSNPNWKKMYFSSAPAVFADKFRQSGFSAFVCLGYVVD
ncbi:MAG: hypothetical protein JNL24_11555 [Bacteroidia bacterium]|nr:hypothetical protein [Bacteroidia bacterium]